MKFNTAKLLFNKHNNESVNKIKYFKHLCKFYYKPQVF